MDAINPSELKFYLITLCVIFVSPKKIESNGETESVVGYYVNLGLTTSGESAARLLAENEVDDGKIDWEDVTLKEIDIRTYDQEIVKHCRQSEKIEVWYKSGRCYF